MVNHITMMVKPDAWPLRISWLHATNRLNFERTRRCNEARCYEASGFANVTTNAGTVSGTAIFSEFDSAGNLIGEAGVPSSSAVTRQSIFVDTGARYSVGVAFANPANTVANITLTLLDSSGVAVSTPVTRTLGAGNHTQLFTSQLFAGVTQPSVGTLQFVSSAPLVTIALRFDPSLSKFTTLPPVTLGP
jgi:hypothetical protein